MLIRYVKADPAGNITALVESAVAESLRPAAAGKLMQRCPETEQVGFVSRCGDANIRLDMAGGEFCGNATLSAAALWLQRSGNERGCVKVSVSGNAEPVAVEISRTENGSFSGCVEMPLPLFAGLRELPGAQALPVVEFPGISHVIVSGSMDPKKAEELIPRWCEALGAEALGIMLFDARSMNLRPLVWVPGSGTLCWEHCCASGSCALAAWLAVQSGADVCIRPAQPGGTPEIEAKISGGRLAGLHLSSLVRLSDAKTLEII